MGVWLFRGLLSRSIWLPCRCQLFPHIITVLSHFLTEGAHVPNKAGCMCSPLLDNCGRFSS